MKSIFDRRGSYPQEKQETIINKNNSNMFRPKNLSFQKGGKKKYNPNGYDVIDKQMFNDIQRANGNAPQNPNTYQEDMSRQLSQEDYMMMQKQALQNQKIGQQLLPKPAYDYLMNNKKSSPQVKQYVNPQYMMQNQYQEGGPVDQGQDQMMQMVAQALQQGTPPEQVMQMLIEQGIPQEQAQMIIQQVMSQMQGQMSPQQPTNGQPMMQQGGYNAEKQIQKLKREMDVFLDPSMSNIPVNQRNSIYNYVNLPFFENKAEQNKKIGKQLLPKQAYDYLINEMGNTPEVRKYVDPYYMVKTQPKYKTGGMRPKGLSYDY